MHCVVHIPSHVAGVGGGYGPWSNPNAVMLLAEDSRVHLGALLAVSNPLHGCCSERMLLAVFLKHACLMNMVCCSAGKSLSCLPLILTLLSAS